MALVINFIHFLSGAIMSSELQASHDLSDEYLDDAMFKKLKHKKPVKPT